MRTTLSRRGSGGDLRSTSTRLQYLKGRASVSYDEIEEHKEDLGELRRRVEDELSRDEQKLSFLKGKLGRAKELESLMDRTLSTFDARLLLLEGVIDPIHQETLKLTHARENLNTVGTLLTEVLRYQAVSRDSRTTLDKSPVDGLDDYISTLEKVKEALEFFEHEAPENPEVCVLQELHCNGLAALQAHLGKLVQENSIISTQKELLAMTPSEVLHCPSMLPEDITAAVIKVAGYLIKAGEAATACRVYARVRCDLLASCLEGGGGSWTVAAGGSDTSHGSRTSQGRSSTVRRLKSIRRKSASQLPPGEGGTAAGGSDTVGGGAIARSSNTSGPRGHKRTPSVDKSGDRNFELDPEMDPVKLYEKGSHPFYQYFAAVAVALQREMTLVRRVFADPNLSVHVIKSICVPQITTSIKYGEILIGSMSRRSLRGPAGLCLLDFLLLFADGKQAELTLILGACEDQAIASQFYTMVHSFAQLARQSLLEFQDYTQEGGQKRLPNDGTVHELTSNTTSFLSALHDYTQVAGFLLSWDGATVPDDRSQLGCQSLEEATPTLVRWIGGVLDILCDNIARKARSYEDHALNCIFLINNYNYIFTTIQASSFCRDFRSVDPQVDTKYLSLIQTKREEYKKVTWDHIVEYVSLDAAIDVSGGLSKKQREAIKDKYSGFNEAFDLVVETQVNYTVPDAAVRESVTTDNINLIVPRYKQFDDRYRTSGFTNKNPHKYLKYQADQIEKRLRTLFSGT
eukprot:m.671625 g.671625  ORF g.671625 m.671625 type:complete len:744 (-) comp22775_c0_seq4:15-2246(-)